MNNHWVQSYIVSVFVAVRGIAKKHKGQDALIEGGLEGEDAGVTQRESGMGGTICRPESQIKEWQTGPPVLL